MEMSQIADALLAGKPAEFARRAKKGELPLRTVITPLGDGELAIGGEKQGFVIISLASDRVNAFTFLAAGFDLFASREVIRLLNKLFPRKNQTPLLGHSETKQTKQGHGHKTTTETGGCRKRTRKPSPAGTGSKDVRGRRKAVRGKA